MRVFIFADCFLQQHESALTPQQSLWQILAAWAVGAGHHITGITTLDMFTLPLCITLWRQGLTSCQKCASHFSQSVSGIANRMPGTLHLWSWGSQNKTLRHYRDLLKQKVINMTHSHFFAMWTLGQCIKSELHPLWAGHKSKQESKIIHMTYYWVILFYYWVKVICYSWVTLYRIMSYKADF